MMQQNAPPKGQVWLTTALTDSDVMEALTLCLSLRRALTSHKVAVIVSVNISGVLRESLEYYFDFVFTLDEKRNTAGLEVKDFAKLFALTLQGFKKCVMLSPNMLVVRNCDELFDTGRKASSQPLVWCAKGDIGSVLVIRPSLLVFKELLKGIAKRDGAGVDTFLKKWLMNQTPDCEFLEEKYNQQLFENGILLQQENNISIINLKSKPSIGVMSDKLGFVGERVVKLWETIREEAVLPLLKALENPELPDPQVSEETINMDAIAIIGMSCRRFFLVILLKESAASLQLGVSHGKEEFALSGAKRDIYKAYKSLPGPSPFPLKLIGNSFLFLPNIDLPQKFIQLAKTYGPHYRLTLINEDFVVLNSPAAAQAVLGSTDLRHFRRGRMLERLWPTELQSLLIWPGGEEWKKRRKILSRPFMTKALQRHNPCWHKQCERMVTQLEERFQGDNDKGANTLVDLLRQCTFGMSSETLMGVDIVQEAEDGALFCQSLERFNKIWYNRIFRPWYLIDWIWRLSSDFRKARALGDRLKTVTFKVIQKYKEKVDLESDENENDELRNSMIEAMLRNGVKEKEIFDEVVVMLGVANDTTPLSAEYALFMLALHPEHQELCRQEIDKAYEDPTKVQNGILEFEALKELKYLERCIQEALRIHPITIILRRLDAPLKIDENLVIPKDVSVIVAPYALHHLPEYYPNPEKFDPDRFLLENIRSRHPYAYLPFSAGPRNCIGMKLAMIELKVMLATILRKFEVRTLDRKEDVKLVVEGSIRPAAPIRFVLEKRKAV
ncbi:unnamed protein product [Orchesella dallaii]|uniref:Cytochrome P450 4C1 n=1 Tax=Orchesella dallaii TaxID=48710 RepID=A0ABP1Q106_9HEXA